MPNVKQYTAKRELKLDCGHTVKSGETYQVVSAFACEKDGHWPISILQSCFSTMARKREKEQSASAVATADASAPAPAKAPAPVPAKATTSTPQQSEQKSEQKSPNGEKSSS